MVERLKQADPTGFSNKNKIRPTSAETEENFQEGRNSSFELESTKIFTNIVDKLEHYYEEKMKIEVENL